MDFLVTRPYELMKSINNKKCFRLVKTLPTATVARLSEQTDAKTKNKQTNRRSPLPAYTSSGGLRRVEKKNRKISLVHRRPSLLLSTKTHRVQNKEATFQLKIKMASYYVNRRSSHITDGFNGDFDAFNLTPRRNVFVTAKLKILLNFSQLRLLLQL